MTHSFEREEIVGEKSDVRQVSEMEEMDTELVFWFRSQLQALALKSISNGDARILLQMVADVSENGFPSFYESWFQSKLREGLVDRDIARFLKEKYEGKERKVFLEESGATSSLEAERYMSSFIEEIKALWEERQSLH